MRTDLICWKMDKPEQPEELESQGWVTTEVVERHLDELVNDEPCEPQDEIGELATNEPSDPTGELSTNELSDPTDGIEDVSSSGFPSIKCN